VEFGRAHGIETNLVALETFRQVQEMAPTPYGTFAIVRDGQLLSYYYMTDKDLQKTLGEKAP
jgi:hypothetical protein